MYPKIQEEFDIYNFKNLQLYFLKIPCLVGIFATKNNGKKGKEKKITV